DVRIDGPDHLLGFLQADAQGLEDLCIPERPVVEVVPDHGRRVFAQFGTVTRKEGCRGRGRGLCGGIPGSGRSPAGKATTAVPPPRMWSPTSIAPSGSR